MLSYANDSLQTVLTKNTLSLLEMSRLYLSFMSTTKLTVGQAIIKFLAAQRVARDGHTQNFFAGMWGIFGHGNVTGLGQALEEDKSLTYYQARNEQAMVHSAIAYAKHKRRLQTFACTSSIGPGATNMVTGAALATINRLPVLLLPGDIFAKRQPGPVLQQLESNASLDISVNDCFKPVSRFWDRIYRWEQLIESLPEVMRVLTSPSETGAVTLCLPQDVQTEAADFPNRFFEPTTHFIARPLPDRELVGFAVEKIRKAKRPVMIAGGGVNYSEAEQELLRFCEHTGLPVAETQAGKGALPHDAAQNLGAIGATGTSAANLIAREADLIIAVGTRLSDFTTASGTQFQNPDREFVSINIDARDACKYRSLALVGDAKATLALLAAQLRKKAYEVSSEYRQEIAAKRTEWNEIRSLAIQSRGAGLSQAEALGIINSGLKKDDVMVAAAGSLPGDMHKLMNVENSRQYHMEYGFSCMGYEVAGGLGIKMAKDSGDVFVLVGDGSYLMMHSELLTSIQERQKIIVVVFVNQKFASIDGLSQFCGSAGFGNEFRFRADNELKGPSLEVDFALNARSFGAESINVSTGDDLKRAIEKARRLEKTTLIAVHIQDKTGVSSFETQWNVPVAEVSKLPKVQEARKRYESQTWNSSY